MIDVDIIMFINNFSKGTIHGYTAVFNMIQIFLETYNTQEYENYKICVYKKSQQGILDLITYFIPENRIIYLEKKII